LYVFFDFLLPRNIEALGRRQLNRVARELHFR
jgi:hypothetical protein